MDLLADIGGTNARVVFRAGGKVVDAVHQRRTADFPSLAALLRDVIIESGLAPTRAALALAGPITGDEVQLTNLPWRFSVLELSAALAIPQIELENDVAAIAWGLGRLEESDVTALTPGLVSPGPRLVVAPGTGLGMAALAPDHRGHWTAVASEGSHAGIAIPLGLKDEDRAALALARDAHSWEDLLSGIGLPRLHRVLSGHDVRFSEEVTRLAAHGDAAAVHTMDVFSYLLGAFAGDMALVFAARGGCYIGGGLLGSIGALFKPELFLEGFRAKDRFAAFMSHIPVFIITHRHPALLGLGVMLDRGL